MRRYNGGIYRKRRLRPGLTGLVQAHEDEVGTAGCNRTLGPVRLLLFDLRVMADIFGILAKGQGL